MFFTNCSSMLLHTNTSACGRCRRIYLWTGEGSLSFTCGPRRSKTGTSPATDKRDRMVRVAALRGETDEAHEKVLQIGSGRDRHRIWSDRGPDLCCDHRCIAADRQQPEERLQQRRKRVELRRQLTAVAATGVRRFEQGGPPRGGPPFFVRL